MFAALHTTRTTRRLLAAGSALAALACLSLAATRAPAAPAAQAPRTTYGPAVRVGGGDARVYVVTRGDAPVEVGVALTDAVLGGLPADGAPGGMAMPDGHHTYDYVLPMPAGNPTPYRFVGLGWNPMGHAPAGIFDRPHFDFHFYTMTEAERAAILPSDPQYEAKATRWPDAAFVPAGYVALPGSTMPLMGTHWGDPKSPELNGQPFAETVLYGTWDGRLTFAEPMVTRAFLETTPGHREPIAVPARYERPGWYATEYRVYRDAPSREYRVALAGLARRP